MTYETADNHSDNLALVSDAYYSLGVLYNRWPTLLPDPEAAIRVLSASRDLLRQCSTEVPQLIWSVYLALGDAYLKLPNPGAERLRQALDCFRAVIENFEAGASPRSPRDAQTLAAAYLGAGGVYRALGERARALASFTQMLELSEIDPLMRRQAGEAVAQLTRERSIGQAA